MKLDIVAIAGLVEEAIDIKGVNRVILQLIQDLKDVGGEFCMLQREGQATGRLDGRLIRGVQPAPRH